MQRRGMCLSSGRYLQAAKMSKPGHEAQVLTGMSQRLPVANFLLPAQSFSPAAEDFLSATAGRKFRTILADPPWQFQNRTGKVAPEHKRLSRYGTMTLQEIMDLPIETAAAETAHLYMWVPNALLPEGLAVLRAWGFQYKSNLVWHKIRKDGGSDGRGVGFYFRNVTELILFGVRAKTRVCCRPAARR